MILKNKLDKPYSWIETIGSKLNVWAWNKRWRSREHGTGYTKDE